MSFQGDSTYALAELDGARKCLDDGMQGAGRVVHEALLNLEKAARAVLATAPKQEVQEPDMRAVCEALGFDPTNHHNAAVCPYCCPAPPAPAVPQSADAVALSHAAAQAEPTDDLSDAAKRGIAPDCAWPFKTTAEKAAYVHPVMHETLQREADRLINERDAAVAALSALRNAQPTPPVEAQPDLTQPVTKAWCIDHPASAAYIINKLAHQIDAAKDAPPVEAPPMMSDEEILNTSEACGGKYSKDSPFKDEDLRYARAIIETNNAQWIAKLTGGAV